MYKSLSDYHKNNIDIYSELQKEWEEFWKNLKLEEEKISSKVIENFLISLNERFVNGGVLLKKIKVISKEEIIIFNNLSETNFFINFFENKNVIEILSEFKLGEKLIYNPDFKEISFEKFKKNLLEDFLLGGAYSHNKSNDKEFLIKSNESIQEFIKELKLSDEIKVYYSNVYWNEFFFDIAWDRTYFIIDYDKKEISILAFTDTD